MIIRYCTIMIIFNLCRVLLLFQVVIKPQPAHGVAHPTDLQLYIPTSSQSSNKVSNTIAIDPTLAQKYL